MAGFNFDFDIGPVDIDKAKLDFYLNSPVGTTGLYLKKRALMMVVMAKSRANKDTGDLANSIGFNHARWVRGQKVDVVAEVGHALYVHEGTKPHSILPNDNQIMRFSSGGRIVYTRQVDHPGNRPNRFLSDFLWVFKM